MEHSRGTRRSRLRGRSLSLALALATCFVVSAASLAPASLAPASRAPASAVQALAPASQPAAGGPLPAPVAIPPFGAHGIAGEGRWRAAGRDVAGRPAIYTTELVPPSGSTPAGIAWMDTRLLAARLYSGSESPGGGPYRYTAPISPEAARTLVAAFNGGFLMRDAEGGYFTEGRVVVPLRRGAASLVVYAGGGVAIGAWGSDVSMTQEVTSVRQNLVPLISHGVPTVAAASSDWQRWGSTCGATSCAQDVPGIEHQWRSGLGITANGALVYATGPALAPVQLAEILVRSGAVRAMELDINPAWPDFATFDQAPGALASPANGAKLVASTVQGPWTFFEPWWPRDFVTLSARSTAR